MGFSLVTSCLPIGIRQIRFRFFLAGKDLNHVSEQFLRYLLGSYSGLHIWLTEHHRNLE